MIPEKRIRLAGNETDSKFTGGNYPNGTPTDPRAALGARIRRADLILGEVCDTLASGDLSIADLWRYSPNAAGLFNLGYGYGYQSREEELRQARHDVDRYYIAATAEPERARILQGRLDRALASCPPDIEPHSPEYFEHVLSGVYRNGGAA